MGEGEGPDDVIRGLDVSHYQGFPDWPILKARHHLSFIIGKVSEGTGYTDASWTWNRDKGHAAGLKVGGYHFARPESSAAATQARRFVGLAGNVDMLVLDLEQSQLSQSATNAWMRDFGDALRQLKPGVTTTAYLGGYAANGSGQGCIDHFDHWWYPRYPGLTSWPSVYDPGAVVQFHPTTGFPVPPAPSIWQFSDRIGGMDANVSNLTIDELFGGTVAITQADADLFARTMSEYQREAGGPKAWQWWNQAATAATQARDNLPGQIQAVIAAIEALPAGPGGGVSKDDVKQAVKDALKEGIS